MALSLSGYSNTKIHKMGRCKGAFFKEYTREDLACYSGGVPKKIKRSFGFVNIAVGENMYVLVDVTNTMMVTDKNTGASTEA